MNVQNMITQSQYNIDKSRKELDKMKEEFNELMWMTINRAEIKLKKEKRKIDAIEYFLKVLSPIEAKYLKIFLGVLSLVALIIFLVAGICFII